MKNKLMSEVKESQEIVGTKDGFNVVCLDLFQEFY